MEYLSIRDAAERCGVTIREMSGHVMLNNIKRSVPPGMVLKQCEAPSVLKLYPNMRASRSGNKLHAKPRNTQCPICLKKYTLAGLRLHYMSCARKRGDSEEIAITVLIEKFGMTEKAARMAANHVYHNAHFGFTKTPA